MTNDDNDEPFDLEAVKRALDKGPVILVDTLQQWGVATSGRAALHFGPGKESCHLTCIGPLEALHDFAVGKLRLRREWFQSKASWPHYDLTSSKRRLALSRGAIFVPGVVQARAEREARKALRTLPNPTVRVETFERIVVQAWKTFLAVERAS